jgi:UDP-galactopyranose mutase
MASPKARRVPGPATFSDGPEIGRSGTLHANGVPAAANLEGGSMDIVALSHLRWDFVLQRPQHLLSRAAREHRVLFVEEPMPGDEFGFEEHEVLPSVTVLVPRVPASMPPSHVEASLAVELRHRVTAWAEDRLVVWHYSVMAEPLSRHLDPAVLVFDCMDELSAFRDAPPQLMARERELMARADLVFTGGHSLWEAKRDLHPRVHPFPSSVDVPFFAAARGELPEPSALAGIERPRLIYAGVIDERIDLSLLSKLANAGIGDVVLAGPIAKIDPADVPRHPRLHQLGMRPYGELPGLFSHADVGLMPFAMNPATRFISPTKTPEYLAAGLPVVSTPIADVVRTYGDLPSVRIAAEPDAFVAACELALADRSADPIADDRLAGMSWDATWSAMERLILVAAQRAESAA